MCFWNAAMQYWLHMTWERSSSKHTKTKEPSGGLQETLCRSDCIVGMEIETLQTRNFLRVVLTDDLAF